MPRQHPPPTRSTEEPRTGVLDSDTCVRLLERGDVGRLAFVAEDGPVIVPVNYCLYRGDPVFRVEAGGHLEGSVCGQPVALEVDELDPSTRSGASVLVRGVAKTFPDGALLERRGLLDLRSWAPGRRLRFLRIRGATVTGREIRAEVPPALWLG